MKRRLSVGAAIAAVLVCETLSAVTPMGFYGKGMVLQRDVPLKFHGRGKPGETVIIRLGETFYMNPVTVLNPRVAKCDSHLFIFTPVSHSTVHTIDRSVAVALEE